MMENMSCVDILQKQHTNITASAEVNLSKSYTLYRLQTLHNDLLSAGVHRLMCTFVLDGVGLELVLSWQGSYSIVL